MEGLSIDVGWPLALYGLPLVLLLPLLAWRSRFPLSRGRLTIVTLLRMLAVALAIVSVAALRVGLPTDALAIGWVVDRSASVAGLERRQVTEDLTAMAAANPSIGGSSIEASSIEWVSIDPSDASSRSDLESDVGAAVALMPRDRVRRLLVATDGRDPGTARALAMARAAGVEVSLLPIGDSPMIDTLAISGLDAPRLLRAQEFSDVAISLFASREVDVSLTASFDGAPVLTERYRATRGAQTARVNLRFPDAPGVHTLQIAAEGAGGASTENDRFTTLVEILPKPRVRIYREPAGSARGGPSVLAAVLEEAGMDVEVVPPQSAFAARSEYDRYALVITDEIELGDLSEEQQRALRSWVEEDGGGLITSTFNRPVRRTPRTLREIEPIVPPPSLPEPRPLELVLVIDRSGSMMGVPMQQARLAASAAVRALRPDARVGAVAFSGAADRVIAPVPMTEADQVQAFISGIEAGGGTNIAAAISAANQIMSNDPRYIHHVILISDGESDPQSALAAAMALAGRGVSISSITIGTYSQLLADIARIGRGRYHVTNAGGLRSLVVSEAMTRQPPAQRQTPFAIRQASRLPMLDGVSFADAPRLAGHALAGLRPGATQVLTATENMPLLAYWHRGLGQVATWTSATSGSWSDALRETPVFRQLFTQLARGMLRTRTVEPPRLYVEPDPLDASRRLVTVASPYVDTRHVPVVHLYRDGVLFGDANAGVAPLRMDVAGPGVWQTSVPAGPHLLVDARMPEDVEPSVALSDEEPYDAELMAFGVDHASLERLAELGGGRVLERPDALLSAPAPIPSMRSLRTPLLLSAILLYLLSLLFLRLPDRALSRAVEAERPSRVPRPSRRSAPPLPPRDADDETRAA